MKMMLCSMLCMLTVLPSMAQRDTLSLNFGWTFSRDSLFRNVETVDLPHDFQGTALAILRSSSLPGRVTITATAQKLKASASWTTQQ
jgi:hypothetical protein